MNKALLLGAAGVVGYLIYRNYQAPVKQPSGAPAPETTGGAAPETTGAAPASEAAASPAASSHAGQTSGLDALYQALIDATAGDSYFTGSGSARAGNVQHWNYYLAKVAGMTAPDPASIWSGTDLTREDMTAAQYWAGVAPVVAKAKGLSGLGMYGGLGQLVMRGW